jgi:hypothetical protein
MAMTESRWLRSARPGGLLEFLREGRASDRKLRLYAVACCRRVHRSPAQVDEAAGVAAVAERYADGLATAEDLQKVYTRAVAVSDAGLAAHIYTQAGRGEAKQPIKTDLLREVFGNPFQQVAFDPAWRTADVQALADAAYEERLSTFDLDPVRLSVLADALEDGGCRDEPLLAHLRGPGPHVRGCWALDLVLGKQ